MNTVDTTTQAAPEILISPPSRWNPLRLRELLSHWELLYFLTKRELQVRYKQSFFGVGWAILQPLAFAAVFALFFGKFFHSSTGGIPYAVFAVVGIVPWLFTANAIQNSAGSLVQDSDLISKVYFPRLALPVSKALSLVIDLVIALAVVVIVVLLYGVAIKGTVYLVPAFLALGVITAFAAGTLFAAMNVRYRDVSVLVPMLVQILFFTTPVIYPGTGPDAFIKGDWQYLWAVNPMVSVIDGFRWALIGTPPPSAGMVLISVASAGLLLTVALSYFRRAEQWFADVI